MEISEFRERMVAYVTGDQASLDDEEWWGQVTDLSLLVLAERARVKRARRAAQSCPARYRGVTQCALLPNHRGDHFSPSTGRWKNDAPVHDAGEYRDPNTGEPTSAEVSSPLDSMTFAQGEALLLDYQREKQERWRREQR